MIQAIRHFLKPDQPFAHNSFGDIHLKDYLSAMNGDFVLFIERQEDGSLDYTYKTWNGNKFPQMPFCDHSIHEIVEQDWGKLFLMEIRKARATRETGDYEYMCILVQKGKIRDAEQKKDIPTITRARVITLPKKVPLDQVNMNLAQIIENYLGTSASMQAIQECVSRTLDTNPGGNTSRRKRL